MLRATIIACLGIAAIAGVWATNPGMKILASEIVAIWTVMMATEAFLKG